MKKLIALLSRCFHPSWEKESVVYSTHIIEIISFLRFRSSLIWIWMTHFFLVKIQYFSYPNVKCCSRVRMHFHVGLKTMLQDLDIMFSYSVVTWSHNVLCIQKNDSVWFFISVLQKVDFSAVEFGSRIIMTHFSKSFRSEIDIESADYIHNIFLRLDW